MEFQTKVTDIAKQRSECALVAVFAGGKLSDAAQTVNKQSDNLLQTLIKRGDIEGKVGQTLLLQSSGIAAERVLLVGFGSNKGGSISAADYRKALQKAASALQSSKAKNASVYLGELTVEGKDQSWQAQQMAEILSAADYQFEQFKSDKKPPGVLKKVLLDSGSREQVKACQLGLSRGTAVANGTRYARDLGNMPPNACTPTYLAKEAKRLARNQPRLSTKILEEKEMRALGMHSLLSVSDGSDEPAKLIVMDYKGGPKGQKPHVLVGKGITFDSGGISLKPGAGMDEMKFDMCGAASVFGTMQMLLDLQLPLNVVVIVAASENMPNGNATKPGDIVTSMSGLTIEILNTDAEGRLVLCDALTYAERFKPKSVVDIATLTGACVVALGKHASGLYSNKEELAEALLDAGKTAEDKAWHMPLWDEYQQQLDSNFADMANIGPGGAGSVTAACFLSRFTKKYDWAHLDIAGTAWVQGGQKGATGRPVPLLSQYLINKAGK